MSLDNNNVELERALRNLITTSDSLDSVGHAVSDLINKISKEEAERKAKEERKKKEAEAAKREAIDATLHNHRIKIADFVSNPQYKNIDIDTGIAFMLFAIVNTIKDIDAKDIGTIKEIFSEVVDCVLDRKDDAATWDNLFKAFLPIF